MAVFSFTNGSANKIVIASGSWLDAGVHEGSSEPLATTEELAPPEASTPGFGEKVRALEFADGTKKIAVSLVPPNNGGGAAGAVYLYGKSNGNWEQQFILGGALNDPTFGSDMFIDDSLATNGSTVLYVMSAAGVYPFQVLSSDPKPDRITTLEFSELPDLALGSNVTNVVGAVREGFLALAIDNAIVFCQANLFPQGLPAVPEISCSEAYSNSVAALSYVSLAVQSPNIVYAVSHTAVPQTKRTLSVLQKTGSLLKRELQTGIITEFWALTELHTSTCDTCFFGNSMVMAVSESSATLYVGAPGTGRLHYSCT